MARIHRVERFHLMRLQRLADRLEVRFAVLLDERFEERHAEHLAFAFVEARREKLVHMVAEEMAMKERTAAVRLHEKLDRGFLLRFTAEYLGDDALQLAAITLVD